MVRFNQRRQPFGARRTISVRSQFHEDFDNENSYSNTRRQFFSNGIIRATTNGGVRGRRATGRFRGSIRGRGRIFFNSRQDINGGGDLMKIQIANFDLAKSSRDWNSVSTSERGLSSKAASRRSFVRTVSNGSRGYFRRRRARVARTILAGPSRSGVMTLDAMKRMIATELGFTPAKIRAAARKRRMHGISPLEAAAGVFLDAIQRLEKSRQAEADQDSRLLEIMELIRDDSELFESSSSEDSLPSRKIGRPVMDLPMPFSSRPAFARSKSMSRSRSSGSFDPETVELRDDGDDDDDHDAEEIEIGTDAGSNRLRFNGGRFDREQQPSTSRAFVNPPPKPSLLARLSANEQSRAGSKDAGGLAKVIITGLNEDIVISDVVELCNEVTRFKSAKMLGGGRADVVFHNQVDAQKVVDAYNGRILDGEPMTLRIVPFPPPGEPVGQYPRVAASQQQSTESPLSRNRAASVAARGGGPIRPLNRYSGKQAIGLNRAKSVTPGGPRNSEGGPLRFSGSSVYGRPSSGCSPTGASNRSADSGINPDREIFNDVLFNRTPISAGGGKSGARPGAPANRPVTFTVKV